MIYTIGNQKLDIPETGSKRKIRTPRQVVPWRDMAETCRNVDAICSIIQKPPCTIVDGIARAGFWGAVFRNRWPKCKLLMNGEKEDCIRVLKQNFPQDRHVQKNIKHWCPPVSDLAILDFDKFTLKKMDQWERVLSTWAARTQHFIFVDGACFGFKFGTLKSYNISNPNEYYYLLNERLKKIISKRIVAVSAFGNAATILMQDRHPRKIKFVPPTNLSLSRGNKVYKFNPNPKRSRLGLVNK